jgi:hypothetical protein
VISIQNGTTTGSLVRQSCVHRVQTRPDEPTREHGSPPDGGLRQEGGGNLVRRQEVRVRLSSQEPDFGARKIRKVAPQSHLGQGDAHTRQRRIRSGQVRQEPSSSSHGQTRPGHDVPFQNLRSPLFCSRKKYI